MTMLSRTIDPIEVIWVLAAVPGLWLWARNAGETQRDLAAARSIAARDGRYLWASFSVLLTRTFVGIEALFVILGVVAMFREQPPDDPSPWFRWVTAGLLVGASVLLSWLAYRWRSVNKMILAVARERVAERRIPRLPRDPPPPPPPPSPNA
jgi:hypothetical protein